MAGVRRMCDDGTRLQKRPWGCKISIPGSNPAGASKIPRADSISNLLADFCAVRPNTDRQSSSADSP
jgi:hypothetical protein